MSQRYVEVTHIHVGDKLSGALVEDLRASSKGWLSAHWVNYRLPGDQDNRSALVFATVRAEQGDEEYHQALSREERAALMGASVVGNTFQAAESVKYDRQLARSDINWLIDQFESPAA